MNTFALKYRQPMRGFKNLQDPKNVFLPDPKLKPLRETLQRQTYSPKHNSFQMDIIDVRGWKNKKYKNQLYLVLININTRYLYIFPLKKKDSDSVTEVLMKFITEVKEPISSITADGERAFLSNQVLDELHKRGIETNFIKADFLNHIRLVDNVIKTLRNMFNGDVSRMMDNKEMQKAVKYLNNSINRSTQLTPTEMEKYPRLEETWLRRVRQNNNAVKEIQEEKGLFNYSVGDILLICLDKNKTKNKFDKKGRNFELLGSFLDYVNGNFAVNLLSKTFEATRSIVVLYILLNFVLIILVVFLIMYLRSWDRKDLLMLLNLMKKIGLSHKSNYIQKGKSIFNLIHFIFGC
jgi:hypothetical protein